MADGAPCGDASGSFRGTSFANADLAGARLGGLDLRGAVFSATRMRGTELPGACLQDQVLVLVDLSGADLRRADLGGVNLSNSVLDATRLQGARLDGARLLSTVLQQADLRPACAEPHPWYDPSNPGYPERCGGAQRWLDPACCRTTARGANLNGANLVAVYGDGADLSDASFTGAVFGEVEGRPDERPAQCDPVAFNRCVDACLHREECWGAVDEALPRLCRDGCEGAVGEDPWETCWVDGYAELGGCEDPDTGALLEDLCGFGDSPAFASREPPESWEEIEDCEAERIPEGCNRLPTTLRGARLDGANLGGLDLGATFFDRSSLDGAVLRQSNLSRASLREVSFWRANLALADLSFNHTVVDVNLTGANLRAADLYRAQVFGTISGATFDLAVLDEAVLSVLDADFPPSFREASMVRTRLTGTFGGAELGAVDLEGAILRDAQIAGLSMPGARIQSEDLLGLRLTGVDLSRGSLDGDMGGGSMWDVNLTGARQVYVGDPDRPEDVEPARLDLQEVVFVDAEGRIDVGRGSTVRDSRFERSDLWGTWVGVDASDHNLFSGGDVRVDAKEVDFGRSSFLDGARPGGVGTDVHGRLERPAGLSVSASDWRGVEVEWSAESWMSLEGVDLRNTLWRGAGGERPSFSCSRCDLRQAEFRGGDLGAIWLDGSDLSRTVWRGVSLDEPSWGDTAAAEAWVVGSVLSSAWSSPFERSRFEWSCLVAAEAPGSTLVASRLDRIPYASALQRAVFVGADLRGLIDGPPEDDEGLDLRGARFLVHEGELPAPLRGEGGAPYGTNVAGLDFGGADLRSADLRGICNPEAARWAGANLRGAVVCSAPWEAGAFAGAQAAGVQVVDGCPLHLACPELDALCDGPWDGCMPDELSCDDGTCRPAVLACDGRFDCPDGEDEADCECPGGTFGCGSGGCIAAGKRCDGQPDCQDLGDERDCASCQEGLVTCDGHCAPESWRCDGTVDCRDRSDEPPDCPDEPLEERFAFDGPCEGGDTCSDEATCYGTGWHGDGRRDCPQGEDEGVGVASAHTVARFVGAIPVDPSDVEPVCARVDHPEQGGLAVPGWCDGTVDCPDASDEAGCGLAGDACAYECDGQCVRAWDVCDGFSDCALDEDEADCGGDCGPDEWECANTRCIPDNYVCDADDDCRDGSDLREAERRGCR